MHWSNPTPRPRLSDVRDLDTAATDSFDCLTERESEVLRLLAGGATNAEMGRALDLAEGTIRNVVAHVTVKLGVVDRTQAALIAFHAGLGSDPLN